MFIIHFFLYIYCKQR